MDDATTLKLISDVTWGLQDIRVSVSDLRKELRADISEQTAILRSELGRQGEHISSLASEVGETMDRVRGLEINLAQVSESQGRLERYQNAANGEMTHLRRDVDSHVDSHRDTLRFEEGKIAQRNAYVGWLGRVWDFAGARVAIAVLALVAGSAATALGWEIFKAGG